MCTGRGRSVGPLLPFLAEQALLPPALDRITLLVLHVAHLIEHVAGLADLAPEVH